MRTETKGKVGLKWINIAIEPKTRSLYVFYTMPMVVIFRIILKGIIVLCGFYKSENKEILIMEIETQIKCKHVMKVKAIYVSLLGYRKY